MLAHYDEMSSFHSKVGGGGGESNLAVNSPLAVLDNQGVPQPRLAAELPSQERGTWIVNPDGTMATTWRIRPNAIWHDGQPVVSNDLLLAMKAFLEPAIHVPSEVERSIDRAEAVDHKTVTIYWKRIYPRAGQLSYDALPDHLVGNLWNDADKLAFVNHPFWTTPSLYISSGPYRAVDWIRGSQVTFRAFDGYFLGRPKIDEVVFQVVSDPNTLVAYLLSGAVDVSLSLALNQAGWATVKPEWDRTGAGQIYSIPKHLRSTQFQLDPTRAKEAALLDVRTRRAMIHALDRTAIADAVSRGASPAAEFMMSPYDPLYPRAQQVVSKYPYDTRRALELFHEAGLTKRGDALVDASGRQFTADIQTTEMADNVTEMTVMASYLQQIGIAVNQTPISPSARDVDLEFRAKFPSLTITGHGIDLPNSLFQYYSNTVCTTGERRFTGGNRGCWSDAEFELLVTVATTTLDATERGNAIVNALRALTAGVPVIPMSFNQDNVAVRKGLVGLGNRPPTTSDSWNIHEWYWQ